MMKCQWCPASLPAGKDKWCSKRCRQTAWRFRQGVVAGAGPSDRPLRLAYADPPYPGLAWKYYRHEATYGGEVDHRQLVSKLRKYDGWALSTSRKALKDVLSLVPGETIVCPWVKIHPGHRHPVGPGNIHEYVLVVPGRRKQPGPRDALVAASARGGDSRLVGRKPITFISWMFSLLGAAPGDTLDDLFPGSGIVGRCWREFSRSPGDGSLVHGRQLPAPKDRPSRGDPGSTRDRGSPVARGDRPSLLQERRA